MLEELKIVALCIVSAVVYGIVHDQITARICIEYFTVFHPPVFATQSPTLLGLGWGVIATWWVGAILGLLLVLAARSGSRPKLSAAELLKPIAVLLVVMACSAVFAGSIGFFLASRHIVREPEWMMPVLDSGSYRGFLVDSWAHIASYATGFIGGIFLCIQQFRRRGGGT